MSAPLRRCTVRTTARWARCPVQRATRNEGGREARRDGHATRNDGNGYANHDHGIMIGRARKHMHAAGTASIASRAREPARGPQAQLGTQRQALAAQRARVEAERGAWLRRKRGGRREERVRGGQGSGAGSAGRRSGDAPCALPPRSHRVAYGLPTRRRRPQTARNETRLLQSSQAKAKTPEARRGRKNSDFTRYQYSKKNLTVSGFTCDSVASPRPGVAVGRYGTRVNF